MNIHTNASADIELHDRDSIYLSADAVENEVVGDEAPEHTQPAMLPVTRQRQFAILICAFFDLFITIGMNQAYGVFLTYYLDPVNNERESFLPPDQLKSKALLAFVGTLGGRINMGQ